jgi:thioredoxin-related protein
MNIISKLVSLWNFGKLAKAQPIPEGWHTTVAAASEAATASDKLVLVKVHADWCGYCKNFDDNVSAMTHLSNFLNQSFACALVKEGTHEGKALKKTHKIVAYPCFLVFEKGGKFIGKVRGYDNAPAFIDAVKAVTDSQQ